MGHKNNRIRNDRVTVLEGKRERSATSGIMKDTQRERQEHEGEGFRGGEG